MNNLLILAQGPYAEADMYRTALAGPFMIGMSLLIILIVLIIWGSKASGTGHDAIRVDLEAHWAAQDAEEVDDD